jgi:hypothetical protein
MREQQAGAAIPARVHCALRIEHLDTAADRMCVRMVQGKGAKDRCTRC